MTQNSLQALALHVGISPGYTEQHGRVRTTSDASRRALLAAMGLPAATAAQASDTLRQLRSRSGALACTTQVVTPGDAALRLYGQPRGAWRLEIKCENGQIRRRSGRALGGRVLSLPRLPWGYHTLEFCAGDAHLQQQLIVTPSRAFSPKALLGKRRQATGLWANLYTVHSSHSWGIGDTTCLQQLLRWTAQQGGDFVGVNPLHALRNSGVDISPYSPVSRLFRNLLYLDITQIPEFAHCEAAKAALQKGPYATALASAAMAPQVDYAGVQQLKVAILRLLHETFQRRVAHDQQRRQDYGQFCQVEAPYLQHFALYCAMDEKLGEGSACRFPAGFENPHTDRAKRFAQDHAHAVDFYCFVQFELDRQLAAAAAAGKAAGMAIGLYQDLAVGTDLHGADPWIFSDLFVPAISVGAPPDDYAPLGQDWGLPPLHPQRLKDQGYGFWRALLRRSFTHSGALRVDHILGLFRLFWIPRGSPAKTGAYMGYPHQDLLRILALESHRHRALVIGEDLGTVPRRVPKVLQKFGILSSKVIYFEKTPKGAFRRPAQYSPMALVTVTTHDHVPIDGYFCGRDCVLRRQVGHLASAAALQRALNKRRQEIIALEAALKRAKLWDPTAQNSGDVSACRRAALHGFLRQTPAVLVGISLDDVVGESDPVNMPGVSPVHYPCWSRRAKISLEQLQNSPEARAIFAGTAIKRGRGNPNKH